MKDDGYYYGRQRVEIDATRRRVLDATLWLAYGTTWDRLRLIIVANKCCTYRRMSPCGGTNGVNGHVHSQLEKLEAVGFLGSCPLYDGE